MEKTDLAYAAGIIDGEGCISICPRQRRYARGGIVYSLDVQVCNTNEWLCQWLKFAFGGSVAFKDHSKHKDIWIWTIAARQARDMLVLILPYLNIKRPQAELAITFQNKKRMVGRRGKSEAELAIEEAQSLLLKNMHRQ